MSQLFSSVLFADILFLISFISVHIVYLILLYYLFAYLIFLFLLWVIVFRLIIDFIWTISATEGVLFHMMSLRTFVSILALIKYLTTMSAISFLIWFVWSVIFSFCGFSSELKRNIPWLDYTLRDFISFDLLLLNLALICQISVWYYSTFDNKASHCCRHSLFQWLDFRSRTGTFLRDTIISDRGDDRSGMSYVYKHWNLFSFFCVIFLPAKGNFVKVLPRVRLLNKTEEYVLPMNQGSYFHVSILVDISPASREVSWWHGNNINCNKFSLNISRNIHFQLKGENGIKPGIIKLNIE